MSLTWARCNGCKKIYTFDPIVHHGSSCSFCGSESYNYLASSPYFADKKEAQAFREKLEKKEEPDENKT